MNEISQERIKRFWEWCGFQYRDEYPDGRGNWGRITFPDGHEISELKFHLRPYPPVDLNNLFKWAVPKVLEDYDVAGLNVWQATDEWVWEIGCQGASHQDNATALFLAIEKLIAEGQ